MQWQWDQSRRQNNITVWGISDTYYLLVCCSIHLQFWLLWPRFIAVNKAYIVLTILIRNLKCYIIKTAILAVLFLAYILYLQYFHTRNLLFCNIRKSGESSISVPSLYHSTFGDGAPFTRHSNTTSCPSEAEMSCNI